MFPFNSDESGLLQVFCSWDIDDVRKKQDVSSKLCAVLPEITEVEFIQLDPTDPGQAQARLDQYIDSIHAASVSAVSELHVCAFCDRADTDVRIVASASGSCICELCVRDLKSLPRTSVPACCLCEFPERASWWIAHRQRAICGNCYELADRICSL